MAVSTLESLPNEILADILENYVNGIDILNAFAFQLNQRFDALIIQSQRLCFNFIRCHKDDFRLCMGLLPAYVNKIEELALAERYTPGQVHAFLSLYPSFDVFQRLRKLNLHIHTDIVESVVLRNALRSLSTTSLHTLSLDISGLRSSFSLLYNIARIFRMKTLKRLLISGNNCRIRWESLKEISSSIEFLTIHGMVSLPADLGNILRCATALRYLRIDASFRRYYHSFQSKLSSTDILPPMAMLHTVILNLKGSNRNTIRELEPYFRCMTALRRLTIKTNNVDCNIDAWEAMIQATLPSLNSFILECNMSHLRDETVSDTLRLAETPFWKAKNQFHVVIKDVIPSKIGRFHSEDSNNFDRDEWFEIITRWCIGPRYHMEKSSSVLNKITNLHLSTHSHSLLQNHYLNNVVHLILTELDDTLLKLLTSHVNCYRIKFLDVSSIKEENNLLFSLLTLTPNIQSLRIRPEQLCNQQINHSTEYNNVQFLDISTVEHTFTDQDISIISQIFPHVEHLIIYTKDLQNVPLLQTHLPHLRSLCYYEFASSSTLFSIEERRTFDHTLREKTKFLFQRTDNWTTIWIDDDALQELWWPLQNTTRTEPMKFLFLSDTDEDQTDTD